jgi:two-component system response regulator YesN
MFKERRRMNMMERIKTVIVDDEPRIRRGIERLVQSCGDEWDIVGVYSDGQEAYDAIINQAETVDVLITDVQMPVMDGLTLIKQLKKCKSTFFPVIISGYDDFQYVQTALREGAVDYILKPIDREKFKLQLKNVQQKVIQARKEIKKSAEIEATSLKLTYEKQLQLLTEVTWKDGMDLSLLEWTRQFPEGTYYLIHIGIDQISAEVRSFSPEDRGIWNDVMKMMIKDLLKDKLAHWMWKNSLHTCWLLIMDNHNTAAIESFCLTLKTAVQRYTPFTVSIALGNEFDDLSLLVNIKDELRSALQFRMIQGGNKIFRTEPLKHVSYNKVIEVPPSIYKWAEETVEAMEHGEEAAIEALMQFFNELKNVTSPFIIQESVRYLSIRIINRWIKSDGFNELPLLLEEAFAIAEESSHFNELKKDTERWVRNMLKRKAAIQNDQTDTIHQAKEWIQKHIGENITIKKIASHVHLNSTYFCEYFKNQTGETVLDYVTNQRLKRAKELLSHTDLKIYDIASKVGYQDTKYFSRLFKQWTGRLPSQYRDSHENIMKK